LTLDTGALIALERGDERVRAVLALALKQDRAVRVPAGVVGQVWRGGSRQATVSRFLRAREVEVQSLDEPLARAAGELCGAAGPGDVIDASVVLSARGRGDTVLTSDPDDLRRLDRTLRIVRV
jgi:predicted nucleic acid-binding protein